VPFEDTCLADRRLGPSSWVAGRRFVSAELFDFGSAFRGGIGEEFLVWLKLTCLQIPLGCFILRTMEPKGRDCCRNN
jgi:hypothetical protein